MILAIDFDDTLTEKSPYPICGKIRIDIIQQLIKFQKQGVEIILFTARKGKYLKEALYLLESNNFIPNRVYQKPEADFYIDNQATLNGEVDWDEWIRKIEEKLNEQDKK